MMVLGAGQSALDRSLADLSKLKPDPLITASSSDWRRNGVARRPTVLNPYSCMGSRGLPAANFEAAHSASQGENVVSLRP